MTDSASAAGENVAQGRGKALMGVLVGGVFLALVAFGTDWEGVWKSLASARLAYLAPIAAVLVCHYFCKALRWRVLLSGTTRLSPWMAFRLTMVGFLMNNVFPARIGELGRPYLLSANRPEVPFSFALATVVGDKLFDLVMVMGFLVATSLELNLPAYVTTGVLVLAGASAAIVAVGFLASFWERRERGKDESASGFRRLARRFGSRGDRVYDGVLGFARGMSTISSPGRAAAALVLSAVSFCFLAMAVAMTMLMLDIQPTAVSSFFVIGMTGIGFMLPSAPTNAGNFHFFAVSALTLSGAAGQDVALSFALLSHATQVVLVTAVGAVSLVGLDWRRIRFAGEVAQ
jgi:uncharacterized protein (TIRG00374 family)